MTPYFLSYFVSNSTLYGPSIQPQTLEPLQPNETLIQDSQGDIHRIEVPSEKSSLRSRIVFFIQTHFSTKAHLDAIPNLLKSFEDSVSEEVTSEEELAEITAQVAKLRSLKNDYGFKLLEGSDQLLDEYGFTLMEDSEQPEEERLNMKELNAREMIDHRLTAIELRAQRSLIEYKQRPFNHFKEQTTELVEGIKAEYETMLRKLGLLAALKGDQLIEKFDEVFDQIYSYLNEAENSIESQFKELEDYYKKDPITLLQLRNYVNRYKKTLSEKLDIVLIEIEYLKKNLNLNLTFHPLNRELIQSLKKREDQGADISRTAHTLGKKWESVIAKLKSDSESFH